MTNTSPPASERPPAITLPGGADRTVVMGATGSGKTTFGAWLLSKQRFDLRPWVCMDFKEEELWDRVGDPPMKTLRLGDMPGKLGLYRVSILPGWEDSVEDWLWEVWKRGNIGLFCDELGSLPKRNAWKAILRQGRSRRIPIIGCTQRPVAIDREIFTESEYKVVFRLADERDVDIVKGFTRNAAIDKPLPRRWSYYYQDADHRLLTLKPCPGPDSIAAALQRAAPDVWRWG